MEYRLKLSGKLLFSLGAIGKNMMYTIVSVYYMFYLTAVQGLSGTIVGLAFAVSRLWDAFNDPMMGSMVDNTRSKWGKFRPWILVGTLINAIVLLLMFLNLADKSQLLKYSIYLTLYVLWGMSYTLMDVPYWSMIPTICTNDKEKASLSSISMLAAGLGNLIIMVGMPQFIIKNFARSAAHPKAYTIASVIVAVVFIICSTIMVLTVKEGVKYSYKKIKFRETFKTIIQNDQLVAYIFTTVAYCIASSILMEISTYYFVYDLGDTRLEIYGFFILVLGGSQAIGMAVFPLIKNKFSIKSIYIFSITSSIIGFLLMFMIASVFKVTNVYLLGACGMLAVFGMGWLQISSVIMLTDVVDYGEYLIKNRTESIVFSLQTFVSKIAASVAALIVGIGIDLAGIQGADLENNVFPPMTNPYGLLLLRIVMFLIPIVLLAFSLWTYLSKYKLKGEYLEDIRTKLLAQRAVDASSKEE